MKKNMFGLAILLMAAMVMIGGCASMNSTGYTMRGGKAEETPPARTTSVSSVPENQSTYHYLVTIYPGLDEKFDPDPKLTLEEYNQIAQMDWYCARQIDKLKGRFKEMSKQGITYGVLQGIMGTVGMMLGFNPMHPAAYLAYIGITGLGGGIASGTITFDEMLNVVHGYLMTNMIYKADELEGKLRRITIIPMYVGSANFPKTSDKPAPEYKNKGFLPPPPRGMR